MTAVLHKVVLTGQIHPEWLARLRERCHVELLQDPSPSRLKRALTDADGVVVRANASITADLIAAAPRLRVIGRHGVGTDNINVHAAQDAGILVVNTPNANARSVAEHVIAGILTLAKQLDRDRVALADGNWSVRERADRLELSGRTLGIVGFGRIGRALAGIARDGFGMKVQYCDPAVAGISGARPAELDQLLETSHVVSVHVPSTPATHGLLDRRALARLRRDAYLVNTSRGGVVDEGALAIALIEQRIAGAVVDVFEDEPAPTDHPLVKAPNTVLTPHTAAMTDSAGRQMAEVVADVLRVLEGQPPRFPVPTPDGTCGGEA